MKITQNEVKKMCRLAKIELDDDQSRKMQEYFLDGLERFDELAVDEPILVLQEIQKESE